MSCDSIEVRKSLGYRIHLMPQGCCVEKEIKSFMKQKMN